MTQHLKCNLFTNTKQTLFEYECYNTNFISFTASFNHDEINVYETRQVKIGHWLRVKVQTVEFSSRSISILPCMDWTVDRKFSKVKVTFVSLDFALTHVLSLLAERLSVILLVAAQSDVLQAPSSWFALLDGRPVKWKRLISLHASSTVKLNFGCYVFNSFPT